MAKDNNARRTVAITNNDQGPRYVHSARGMEVVQPGQTLTTEASGAQVDAIKLNTIADTDGVPMFSVGKSDGDLDTGADEGNALDALTLAQLRKVATAEDVILTGRKDPTTGEALPDLTSAADIRTAIEAHRAANPAGSSQG